jgi:predicted O-methyltransferase YrrM
MRHTLEHAAKVSDIYQHLVRLYELVVRLDAKEVIELGVRGGESTVALLEAVHETKGRLVSVDVSPCLEAREMIERYRLASRWEFYQSDSVEFGRKMILERPFDVAFVDTSHTYEQTCGEIKAFAPNIRSSGAMAFHDTLSAPDVMRAIKDCLPGWRAVFFENNNGLGILYKP